MSLLLHNGGKCTVQKSRKILNVKMMHFPATPFFLVKSALPPQTARRERGWVRSTGGGKGGGGDISRLDTQTEKTDGEKGKKGGGGNIDTWRGARRFFFTAEPPTELGLVMLAQHTHKGLRACLMNNNTVKKVEDYCSFPPLYSTSVELKNHQ